MGLFSTFFLLLLVPGIGGAWEEPGWRGYALPRLQVGRSALFASLILWIGIVVWHLPLFIVGEIHWSDVVFILGFVIVFNWVFNNANGSVLILMLISKRFLSLVKRSLIIVTYAAKFIADSLPSFKVHPLVEKLPVEV